MSKNNVQQIHMRVNDDEYQKIKNLAHKRGIAISELLREFINYGLQEKLAEENLDLISAVVRKQVDLTIKPHVERLARLSSKTGHMAATSTFLNAQALVDLVPEDRRRDIKPMYEKARKQAVEFMQRKTTEYETEF